MNPSPLLDVYKRQLLNMIGGIETPDKGSIIVNGFDVAKKGKKPVSYTHLDVYKRQVEMKAFKSL